MDFFSFAILSNFECYRFGDENSKFYKDLLRCSLQRKYSIILSGKPTKSFEADGEFGREKEKKTRSIGSVDRFVRRIPLWIAATSLQHCAWRKRAGDAGFNSGCNDSGILSSSRRIRFSKQMSRRSM